MSAFVVPGIRLNDLRSATCTQRQKIFRMIGIQEIMYAHKPGELALALYEELTAIQYGRKEDKHNWMTYLD